MTKRILLFLALMVSTAGADSRPLVIIGGATQQLPNNTPLAVEVVNVATTSNLAAASASTLNVSGSATVAGFTNSAALTMTGSISPAAINGTNNDYNPAGLATTNLIRQDASGAATVTGIAAQATGQELVIQNISTVNAITLTNEDAASAAANRFTLPNAVSWVIPPGGAIWIRYSGSTSRWRPVSSVNSAPTLSALTVTGNTSLNTATVSGTLGVTGNFAVNTNKFNVTASNGNTTAAGTLGVTGDFAVNTNKFNVTASNGNTTVAGTLGVTSDVAVNTNKFNVTASNGNTTIAGTLGVTGLTTLSGGLAVTGNSTYTATDSTTDSLSLTRTLTAGTTDAKAGIKSVVSGTVDPTAIDISTYAGRFENSVTKTGVGAHLVNNYGIYGHADGGATVNWAGFFDVSGATGATDNRGIQVQNTSTGGATNYGVHILVSGTATTQYGIKVGVVNGTTNRALETSDGDVVINGQSGTFKVLGASTLLGSTVTFGLGGTANTKLVEKHNTSPTLAGASCTGTGSSVTGSDWTSTIVVGTTATACDYTFTSAFSNAPSCFVTPVAGAAFTMGTSTTTKLPLTGLTNSGSYTIQCIGH